MSQPTTTPLREYRTASGTVYVKDETCQIGGSFKFRGPHQFFASHPEIKRVVTASSGNHAIGVCTAAKMFGASALIYLPEDIPVAKTSKIRNAGGVMVTVAGTYEDALAAAKAHAEREGEVFLPSYNHPLIIEGNRGVFREARAQAGCEFDRTFVPVGGGGCVSAAIEEYRANSGSVVAVEYEPYVRVRYLALDGHDGDIQVNYTAEPSTEGVAIKTLGALNRRILSECENLELATANYEESVDACRRLYRDLGIKAELGACLGFAAALKSDVPEQKSLCVVTGGNIDSELHSKLITRME